jgi:hypothetical protein
MPEFNRLRTVGARMPPSRVRPGPVFGRDEQLNRLGTVSSASNIVPKHFYLGDDFRLARRGANTLLLFSWIFAKLKFERSTMAKA